MQDKAGGLEIENPKQAGEFIVSNMIYVPNYFMSSGIIQPAPYIDGAIIVNAGDFLMRCALFNRLRRCNRNGRDGFIQGLMTLLEAQSIACIFRNILHRRT
jgi:hypothetical protein